MEPFSRIPNSLLREEAIPAKAKAVYAAIDGFLNKRTGDCSPRLDDLCGELGFSRRSIQYMIARLEADGWIVVERAAGKPIRFVSERSERGFVLARSTRATACTGTRATACTGSTIPPNSEARTPERTSQKAGPAAETLFHEQEQRAQRAAIAFALGDVPELSSLASWFPDICAGWFTQQGWNRPTDTELAVALARKLHALGATEIQTAAAFHRFADPTGGIPRPDQIRRVLSFLESQRTPALTPAPVQINSATSPAELTQLWVHFARGPGHRWIAIRELTDGFEAMVEAGHDVEYLRQEILRDGRDRSESWQTFRVRLTREREAKPSAHERLMANVRSMLGGGDS